MRAPRTVSGAANVRALAAGEEEARWDRFVRETPGGTFCHLSGWGRLVEDVLGHRTHRLVAESSGEIRGVLPLGHVKTRLFGAALISCPFLVYGGAVAADEEARAALEARARDLAESLDVGYLELRYRDAPTDEPPQKDLYVAFRKTIAADAEENLKAIPRKQRAMVRKGMQAGLDARVDADVGTFYGLHAESVRNLGTPVLPMRWFAAIAGVFGRDCEVLTIRHRGEPVASVMSFYFGDEVLPYYAGGGPAARDLKANDFMYWELMRRAGERGIRTFDYGRSKVGTGSYAFKKNWGFEPKTLPYRYHLVGADTIPDLSPKNPKYELAVKLWQRLPLGLTLRLGPPIARGLG